MTTEENELTRLRRENEDLITTGEPADDRHGQGVSTSI